MKKRISIFIFLLLISASCEENNEHVKGKYLFKATAINHGDTGLVTLNVYALIFYPDEHELLSLSDSKWRAPSYPERDYILHDYDSVQISIDSSVYVGCIVDILIGFHFKDKESKYHVKNINMHDTVETEDAFEMRFNWPADTFNLK
jgi:hypothetical protein